MNWISSGSQGHLAENNQRFSTRWAASQRNRRTIIFLLSLRFCLIYDTDGIRNSWPPFPPPLITTVTIKFLLCVVMGAFIQWCELLQFKTGEAKLDVIPLSPKTPSFLMCAELWLLSSGWLQLLPDTEHDSSEVKNRKIVFCVKSQLSFNWCFITKSPFFSFFLF